MGEEAEAETNYYSKDFEWETLKQEIENNPSFTYHLLPFVSSSSSSSLLLNQEQLQTGDSQAWQRFHIRHSTGKFFKERRYLLKEFPELLSCKDFSKLLEVGCGNGSSLIPILRYETLSRAKEIVDCSDIASIEQRFKTFYSDFASTGFPKWLLCDSCRLILPHEHKDRLPLDVKERSTIDEHGSHSLIEGGCCIGGVDFVTLIFTLSAVPFKSMPKAIFECLSVLKPGGLLLFRDYGLYDMTMLRFEPDKRVGFREYMRADGTQSYFFSLDTVRDIFVGAGFIELELEYCCVKSVNRRKGNSMRRVWVHGKFQKPI